MSGAWPSSRPRRTSSCSADGPSTSSRTRCPTRARCARPTMRFCRRISRDCRRRLTAAGTSSVEAVRRRALLVGVGEDADVVELRSPSTKLCSSAKSASVSPGKPTMNVVRSVTPGTRVPDPVEQPLVAGARAGPLHPLQHRVRRVLQRQVDVLADLLALRHRLQHVVADRGRIEVEHPDPLEAVDAVERAQQPRQRAALAAVDAVEARVLRDQQQLLDAARGQRSRLARRSSRPAGCDSCRAASG